MSEGPRIAYAANRKLGFDCLRELIAADLRPVCVLLPSADRASYAAEILEKIGDVPVLEGRLTADDGVETLREVDPHYLLSVHYPYMFSAEVLAIPRLGALNLHPSWLPYGRGWHTPSWAILEQTPIGASLHWISAELDAGDIALQRNVTISAGDTADSLYHKVLAAEAALFAEALPLIRNGSLSRAKQPEGGTFHRANELEGLRRVDVDSVMRVGDLLDRLRALTTDRPEEWAWIETAEGRFRIGLRIERAEPRPCGAGRPVRLRNTSVSPSRRS